MTPTPTPSPIPADVTVHVVGEASRIGTYAPFATACAALVAALVALAGVVWNNNQAAKRQSGDLRAAIRHQKREFAEAEARRVRDATAAEERERERHRRENLSKHVGDLIANAVGVTPIATNVLGFTRRLRLTPGSPDPAVNMALSRELDDLRGRLIAQLDRTTSLSYQVQMLAPPDELTLAIDRVVYAAVQLSRASQEPANPAEGIPKFEDGINNLKTAAQDAVRVYRSVFEAD
ncbi:hypothetical protein ACXYTP_21505 [Tsukamurella ocularis]